MRSFKSPFLGESGRAAPSSGGRLGYSTHHPLTSLQQGSKADTTAGWMEHYRAGSVEPPPSRCPSCLHLLRRMRVRAQRQDPQPLWAWRWSGWRGRQHSPRGILRLWPLQARLSAVLRLSNSGYQACTSLPSSLPPQTEDSWCLPHLARHGSPHGPQPCACSVGAAE